MIYILTIIKEINYASNEEIHYLSNEEINYVSNVEKY